MPPAATARTRYQSPEPLRIADGSVIPHKHLYTIFQPTYGTSTLAGASSAPGMGLRSGTAASLRRRFRTALFRDTAAGVGCRRRGGGGRASGRRRGAAGGAMASGPSARSRRAWCDAGVYGAAVGPTQGTAGAPLPPRSSWPVDGGAARTFPRLAPHPSDSTP
jgi:hypothetical protein